MEEGALKVDNRLPRQGSDSEERGSGWSPCRCIGRHVDVLRLIRA